MKLRAITSTDPKTLVRKTHVIARAARTYGLPVIASTALVRLAHPEGLIPELRPFVHSECVIDRTVMNAWEEPTIRDTVAETGRRHVILCGVWTGTCVLAALHALRDGFHVNLPVDVVGSTSELCHDIALRRAERAGVTLTTLPYLLTELQGDFAHDDTVDDYLDMLGLAGVHLNLAGAA